MQGQGSSPLAGEPPLHHGVLEATSVSRICGSRREAEGGGDGSEEA